MCFCGKFVFKIDKIDYLIKAIVLDDWFANNVTDELFIQLELDKNAPKLVRFYFCAIIEINKRRSYMIGENIKTLRKTHKLTQPEFAKIVGISRNSLSRYENGTSRVSTELIDRICKKFNVSYIDIVGEEKMLTPVEDYQLTLKIEVIKERGANILAQLYRFQDEQGIAFDDTLNPWVPNER